MNKQLAQIHLCPWELIDLDVSNLEFVVVFFKADAVEKNQNKYSKFHISKLMSYQGYWLNLLFFSSPQNYGLFPYWPKIF